MAEQCSRFGCEEPAHRVGLCTRHQPVKPHGWTRTRTTWHSGHTRSGYRTMCSECGYVRTGQPLEPHKHHKECSHWQPRQLSRTGPLWGPAGPRCQGVGEDDVEQDGDDPGWIWEVRWCATGDGLDCVALWMRRDNWAESSNYLEEPPGCLAPWGTP